MKKYLLVTFLFLMSLVGAGFGQGLNHNFLIGYDNGVDTNVISTRAIMGFDSNNLVLSPDSFSMVFSGTQGNISDEQGNLLMYSNGCWIADRTGKMMQNGNNINPGLFVNSYCTSGSGLPFPNINVFIPWPGDSTRYVLLHQRGSDITVIYSTELYYSIIDITLNGGLGAVTNKNVIAFQSDSLCPSIGACKHANGRDWWIVVLSQSTDTIYKFLLTPNGIMNMPPQSLGLPPNTDFRGTVQFSPDGTKFGFYNAFFNGANPTHRLRVLNFDRCSGMFSNPNYFDFISSTGGFGMAFSPNSKYIYYGTFRTLFQINTYTINMAASIDTVAIKDSYCYPYSFNCPDFWYKYLAPNGKIYISSGGTVIDMHFINQPDSDGVACDVQLHGLRLPCRTSRDNVYHPNYYLGPVVGSACDTLAHVGFYELTQVNNVSLQPNPTHDGNFRVSYLLPQNKNGNLVVTDMMGKQVYKINLPQWSTMQDLSLYWLSDGVYTVTVQSENSRSMKRLMILK